MAGERDSSRPGLASGDTPTWARATPLPTPTQPSKTRRKANGDDFTMKRALVPTGFPPGSHRTGAAPSLGLTLQWQSKRCRQTKKSVAEGATLFHQISCNPVNAKRQRVPRTGRVAPPSCGATIMSGCAFGALFKALADASRSPGCNKRKGVLKAEVQAARQTRGFGLRGEKALIQQVQA
jgi:hypothetical protein